MPTTKALITHEPHSPFQQGPIERRDPRPSDVVIEIKYSGICHSDIHQARQEWGRAIFPMVPGHEIAGLVTEVGSAVTKYQVGDRVGVGCMVDSCRECENCLAGQEQYCLGGNVMTYNGLGKDGEPTLGGYSQSIVVDERFVCKIPDAIRLDVAAPLLCAGITLYSPLKHWGAGPGKRVAIVGMGGLGHMGVQIAAAMGAEVVVLSHSMSQGGRREVQRRLSSGRHLVPWRPGASRDRRVPSEDERRAATRWGAGRTLIARNCFRRRECRTPSACFAPLARVSPAGIPRMIR